MQLNALNFHSYLDFPFGLQVVTPNVPDIQVIPPEDEHLRHVIDTMAMYVLDDGCAFEQAIMERGRGTTLFSFLFDLGSTEHTYYIWRLYSFAQVRCCSVDDFHEEIRSWKRDGTKFLSKLTLG